MLFPLLPSALVPWSFQRGVKGSGKCMGLWLGSSSFYSAITKLRDLGQVTLSLRPHSVFFLVSNQVIKGWSRKISEALAV